MTRDRAARSIAGLAPLAAIVGCELHEVVLAEPEDVVVAEVLVQVRDDAVVTATPTVFALLHRTLPREGSGRAVSGARIVIEREDGPVALVEQRESTDCVWSTPEGYGGTCYEARASDERRFQPGDALTVEIDLPDGGRLEGAARIPDDFELRGTFAEGIRPRLCALPPDTTLEVRWSPSPGAWAYVTETAIRDFRAGLAERGIVVPQDYLHLMGLAISAADTSIVFPSEFGLLERFDVDRDLMVALQGGLPRGAAARVAVSAVERNYANWARGGTFNPSGQVRIPSLAGDGTGFFGAAVMRTMQVVVPPRPEVVDPSALPPCG